MRGVRVSWYLAEGRVTDGRCGHEWSELVAACHLAGAGVVPRIVCRGRASCRAAHTACTDGTDCARAAFRFGGRPAAPLGSAIVRAVRRAGPKAQRGPARGPAAIPEPPPRTHPSNPQRVMADVTHRPAVMASHPAVITGRELAGRRTVPMSVYANPDGTQTARVYTQPVHYRMADDSWVFPLQLTGSGRSRRQGSSHSMYLDGPLAGSRAGTLANVDPLEFVGAGYIAAIRGATRLRRVELIHRQHSRGCLLPSRPRRTGDSATVCGRHPARDRADYRLHGRGKVAAQVSYDNVTDRATQYTVVSVAGGDAAAIDGGGLVACPTPTRLSGS